MITATNFNTANANSSLARKTGPCPCKDCSARYPACHGHCQAYKAWKEATAEVVATAKNDRLAASTLGINYQARREAARKAEAYRRPRTLAGRVW